VRLIRDDGSLYDEKGTLDFSGLQREPDDRRRGVPGRIANPARVLLPRMYVNVRLMGGHDQQGLPRAAARGAARWPGSLRARGGGGDGKIVQKRVDTVSVVDNHWIISGGLVDGDQVIVDNLQKIGPGMPVKAKAGSARRWRSASTREGGRKRQSRYR
jgi:membrane fusion protein (multidrug efflux system)